ncbi:DsrE family protein [Caldivirga sp. UBA161]|uniref:DsrE family protein n=1 Tax=Caldivirga sp. UBA161 TaxID=1915569 RepID=UPI0025C0B0DB|nr:DsrE family protein [Caldivirga sp. UBA161]
MVYRVIVQVSDLEKVKAALISCRNLLEDISNIQLEVVFNQTAVKALTKGGEYESDVNEFIRRGVLIVACRNAMRLNNINEGDLISGVTTVNSGVGEIVRKMANGWLYLRL